MSEETRQEFSWVKNFFSLTTTEQHKKSSKLAKIFQRTDILLLFTCFLTSFNSSNTKMFFLSLARSLACFIISLLRTHYWIIKIMRNASFTYTSNETRRVVYISYISRAREAIKPSLPLLLRCSQPRTYMHTLNGVHAARSRRNKQQKVTTIHTHTYAPLSHEQLRRGRESMRPPF